MEAIPLMFNVLFISVFLTLGIGLMVGGPLTILYGLIVLFLRLIRKTPAKSK